MIKSILITLDGSEHSQAASQYGVWLAEQLQATAVGMHVVDVVSIEGSGAFLHDVSGSLGFEPYLDFSSKMREALQERGRMLLEQFLSVCGERGVRADTQLATGIVANEICEQARTADLVVVGHRGLNEQFSTGLLGGTTESVTRKCPKPVLVSPLVFRPIARPLLAYDGSQRAAAAMHEAAELCSALKLPLTVLNVCKDDAASRKIHDEARRYLATHRIDAQYVTRAGHANEVILEVIGEGNYDLLLIGAYGHSRIIEMVLGSTTEYVLRNAPPPVFLCR
jgi:nucleotide-binding universal stress UspA family protein